MRAEDRLGYETNERTRFRVRVELNEDLSGTPRVEWVRGCRSLEEAQRGYVALRDRTGYGASQFGFGQVFDEAGQLIGHISYNGRLWAPSPDGSSPWRPGVLAIAEAPTEPTTARGLINKLAEISEVDLAPERSAETLRALATQARSLMKDPRSGITPAQTDPNAHGVRVWAGGPEAGAFTQGPSPDLGFVGALDEGDLVQGFSAAGEVLTEGVKTAEGVAWSRVHRAELDRARAVVADVIYETAEFGGAVILDCGGWEVSADEWVRPIFLEPEAGTGDSLRGVCVLRFHPASDEAASLSLDGEDLLVPEHERDYPVISPENGPDLTPGL